jgi:hypothetical protein
MRPTCTTKDLEEGIIKCFKKKTLKRGLHINVGSLFMRKQAVENASFQYDNGMDACTSKVRPVSMM